MQSIRAPNDFKVPREAGFLTPVCYKPNLLIIPIRISISEIPGPSFICRFSWWIYIDPDNRTVLARPLVGGGMARGTLPPSYPRPRW